MKISPRETMLAVATLSVALFVGTGLLASSKLDEFKTMSQEQQQLRMSIERNKRLVENTAEWTARMGELQNMMPRFPQSKRMDVHWSTEMEKKAATHNLKIIRHEMGAERQEGPIYELPIECRDWEGSLDSLVHFLFDLQSEGAMLDIRYLRIKPKDKIVRSGRFSLYCAYMRETP